MNQISTIKPLPLLFESNGETLRLVELDSRDWVLEEVDRLFQIGFGSDHPMPRHEHVRLIEDGVVIGVLNQREKLVGMRAIVRDWRDSLPLDPPIFDSHAIYPYVNHAVIDPAYRGGEVSTMIARYTRQWLTRNRLTGMRTSVAPWNLRNIGYFTKNGGLITDFKRHLYGENEHRFHGILLLSSENETLPTKSMVLELLAKGDIEHVACPGRSGKYIAIELKDCKDDMLCEEGIFDLLEHYLNQAQYNGICLVKPEGGDQSLLVLEKDDRKDGRLFGRDMDPTVRFGGLKDDTLLQSTDGSLKTLDDCIRRPEKPYRFLYREQDETPAAPMIRHPFATGTEWVSLSCEARTKLIRVSLPQSRDFGDLYALDATGCLTGSIKDHATEFVATFMAHQAHLDGTVMASTGNMGASEAAGMAKIGKVAHVFVPARTPQRKLDKILKFGGEIHLVDGSYDDAVRTAKTFAKDNPRILYSGETAIRLAGNAITSKMIVDKLGRYPNRIIVPVGDGGHYLGLLYGFEDLRRAAYKGGCDQLPQVLGVQVDECNPIFLSHAQGRADVRHQSPDTTAEAIAVGEPLYGDTILNLLYDRPQTCRMVSVGEETIPVAQRELRAAIGTEVEESTAVVWSALRRQVESHDIMSDETTILLLTGHQSNTR